MYKAKQTNNKILSQDGIHRETNGQSRYAQCIPSLL